MPSGLTLEPPSEKNSWPSASASRSSSSSSPGRAGWSGAQSSAGSRRRPVVGVGHRDPAAGAVLLALEGAAVVPVAAVAGRHRQVGLAGARLDLVEDRLAQLGEVGGLRLGVVVLGLEVGRHLGRALVAQPFVVVDAGPAVVLGGDGAALCRRQGGCTPRNLSPRPTLSSQRWVDRRGRSSSTTGALSMWRSPRICGGTPHSCGAICGTRRMSKFLRRTPCAALRPGHRTLPPINQRPWPKRRSGIRQERRSAPRGNLWRRPGDGVGGVGGPAWSRGASPSLLTEGLLVLIPSRGPHPCFRSGIGPAGPWRWSPSPSRLAGGDAGPESPTVRRGGVGKPESQPVRRLRSGTQVAAGSPEVAWGTRVVEGFGRRRPGSGPQPACRRWTGTRTATKAPHRGATRGGGPMTGAAGDGGAGRTRWASSPPRPEGLLVLIPPGDLKTLVDHRLAGGRSGPDRNEDPHHEETRGVGPVTGTAGSERRFGRGGRHHFRLKAEGPL